MGKWGMIVEEDLLNGTIQAKSLDFIINKYSISQIDILKIDIETSEKQLFADNYNLWLPKVDTILIELHDCIWLFQNIF